MTSEATPPRHVSRPCAGMALILLTGWMTGCTTIPVLRSADPPSEADRSLLPMTLAQPDRAFEKALWVCRFWKGGRPPRRWEVPPSNPYVSICLRGQGWNPDGTPAFAENP